MNFVFISPQFPEVYRHFCEGLARDGACVLGVGDTPYDLVSPELKEALTEYYWVPSLEDYGQVFRAVAYFSYRYGKVDWIESNNEYWLGLDARLREDFNVTTGVHPAKLVDWTSKAAMKPCYRAAGIPVARQVKLTSLEAARDFAAQVGYPLFAKPEVGMGSGGAWKVENDGELQGVFARKGDVSYVLEEFVGGEICSYDAIVNSRGEVLFENQEEFPPSMADVHSQALDISYYSCPDVDPRLRELGRAAIRSFGYASRFVHLEFFRLTAEKPGLGSVGDYVGLEVNSRPPGGYSPEMMNYAHSIDVYQVWADMVCFDESHVVKGGEDYFCVHASRRDQYAYAHSHEDVMARWGDAVMSAQRMPDGLSDDLGNFAYVGRFKTKAELDEFVSYVQERN